jgi:predicted lipid carrier protein YhbT
MSSAKILAEIKKDLFSNDETVVMKALNQTRDNGNASFVEPLLSLYTSTPSALVKAEIADMLSNLKVSETDEAFLTFLEQPQHKAFYKDVVAFMWNSGLEPVDHMAFFVKLAIEGDEALILEVLTLIESIESEFPEDQISDSTNQLRTYLGNEKDGQSNRVKLLRELLKVVESAQESYF